MISMFAVAALSLNVVNTQSVQCESTDLECKRIDTAPRFAFSDLGKQMKESNGSVYFAKNSKPKKIILRVGKSPYFIRQV